MSQLVHISIAMTELLVNLFLRCTVEYPYNFMMEKVTDEEFLSLT